MQVIAFRGQGVFVNGFGFGTIQRHAASVDGEDFVIVKFRDGERLVSVLELQSATEAMNYFEANEPVIEEEETVFGEAADEVTTQDLAIVFDRASEFAEDDEEEITEEEEAEEMAEETE